MPKRRLDAETARRREFVAELERQRACIIEALRIATPGALARALHSIKGCAALMGESRIVEVAHALEATSPEEVARKIPELDREISAVAQSLRVGLHKTGRSARGGAASILDAFEQKVRDFAAEHGKQVDFRIDARTRGFFSESTRPLFSALTHAIINAIDHGIESPTERLAAGKTSRGKIELVISSHSIVVRDDGRGVLAREVADRAVEQGLVPRERIVAMTDPEILQLVFLPSLSLARKLTRVSGRGVGLEGVLREAERLGGTAWIESTPGQGTEIHVELVARGQA